MKTFLFAILALFIPSLLAGQVSLSGLVNDERGVPLSFANVRLLTTTGEQLLDGTTTDENGEFQLQVPTSSTLLMRVDFLGYTPWDTVMTVRGALHLPDIRLRSEGEDLAEIIVTAARPILEQKAEKLWFNVASSPLKTGYDGLEVLERTPNVWITDEGAVLLRNEPAQILINGRPLRLEGTARSSYLQSLNSTNILRVEIVTNAGANQTAEGAGGTINIVLKRPIRGWNGTLRANYLYRRISSRILGSGLNLNYGGKNWNIYGAYDFVDNRRYAEEFSTTDYFVSNNFLRNEQVGRDSFYRHNFRLGAVVEVHPNHVFGGELYGNTSDFVFTQENEILLTAGGIPREDGNTLFTGFRDLTTNNALLNYTWTVDTLGTVVRFFGDYTTAESSWYNTTQSTYRLGTIGDNQDRNTTNNRTLIKGLQADVELPQRNGLRVDAGLKWTVTERSNSLRSESLLESIWLENDRSTAFDFLEEISAAYLTASKQLSDAYYFKIGLRAERTQLEKTDLLDVGLLRQDYVNLFPSLFLSRKISPVTTLSLSYSKRLRRPPFSFLNNNVRKFNDFRYEIGNPNLGPEYIHRFELAAKVKAHQFAWYYHKTANAINGIYFLEGEVAYYQRFNEGNQTQYGLEYNHTGDLFSWWNLRARVQLFSRQFIDANEQEIFQQTSLKTRATSTFQLAERTRLEVRGTYYSQQADAYFIRSPLIELDAMLQQQLLNKKLTVRLHIRDILQTLEFANERPFDTFRTTSNWRIDTRTINLRLIYQFTAKEQVSTRKNRARNEALRRM